MARRSIIRLVGIGSLTAAALVAGSTSASAAAKVPAVAQASAVVHPGVDSVLSFGTAPAGVAGPVGRSSIVAVAATRDGKGYWVAEADGSVLSFGDARSYGSLAGIALNQPIVGMAATADGHGYWLVASDGGVFTFGDARFLGSLGAVRLAQPIVGMAATANARGYWLVAADGGVFTFGNAVFHGSLGRLALAHPVVGMAATADDRGYWLVAADGGVFTLGDAVNHGSGAAVAGPVEAVGLAPTAGGYWIAFGEKESPVPAIGAYVAGRSDNVTVAVDDLTDGQMYFYRPGVVEHTASTVKVDILATLLRQAQAEGRGLTAGEQSLAVPMIEDSLDSAADSLWVDLGPGGVGGTEQAVGMTATVPATDGIWGTTTTTAADRLDMIRAVVFGNTVLDNSSRAYILYLMEHITPSQDWGLTGGVPSGVTVALKNGFSIINGWQINSTGWVDGQGRDYLMAVLTDENPSEAYGIQTADAVSSIVWNALR